MKANLQDQPAEKNSLYLWSDARGQPSNLNRRLFTFTQADDGSMLFIILERGVRRMQHMASLLCCTRASSRTFYLTVLRLRGERARQRSRYISVGQENVKDEREIDTETKTMRGTEGKITNGEDGIEKGKAFVTFPYRII